VRVITNSPDETKKIGFKFGKLLKPGQTVCLYGDLGAGKTTFVKGIAKALGIKERDIMSASFTIISEHEAEIPLYHIDLYRIEKGADMDTIGIYDYIGGNGIAVIEWAEKIDIEDSIKVNINLVSKDKREIIIEGINEKDWNNM
jgi:tRNA threonylcarbamoyladenosine biosynthesis protein TsaE